MRVNSARGLVASATLLSLVIWVGRDRIFQLLELGKMLDHAMFLQVLPLFLIFALAFVAGLVMPKGQPAKSADPSNPAMAEALERIQERLDELGQKVANLHAMSTIRAKKSGD